MKNQGGMVNFARWDFWTVLVAVLLMGCGGGDGGSGSAPEPGPVTSDSLSPAVVFTAPASGTIDVAVDASLKIIFTEALDPATVNGSTVKVRTGVIEVGGTVHCANDTVTFTPATNWGMATTYTVTILGGGTGVRDLAGNSLAADNTWTFTTGKAPDTNPPAVTATNPINGATGISVNTAVTVIFSEAVMPVSHAVFRLTSGGVGVLGTVSTSGSTVIFTPNVPLDNNTTYTATVTTGVTDFAGNSLAAEHTWTFFTGQAPGKTPPTLSATNPINGATDVSIQTSVTAIFDEAVTNVSGATFLLAAGGVAVPGTVSTRGSMAIFTPSVPLACNTTYIATVTTGVTNLAGYPLGAGVSWTFTTSRRYWGTATIIDTGSEEVSAPHVVTDRSGNSIAVWQRWDGIQQNLWANRFTPETGWGTATLIETGPGNALAHRLATDRSGNAIAVWEQWDGTRYNVWSNRFVSGTGWGTASLIGLEDGAVPSLASPDVAMDDNGNAIAVWRHWDGTQYNVWSKYYVPGSGWGTATFVGSGSPYGYPSATTIPRVVMDGSGHAIAVWQGWDGQEGNIWGSRFAPTTGWGPVTLIGAGQSFAASPQVAMDGSGNAVAVWVRGRYEICANRFMPASGWGTATLIETGSENAFGPQLAMDSRGNAIVVWQQLDDTGWNVWANHFAPETGWGTATVAGTARETFGTLAPRVAMDGSGNAIVVWGDQRDGIWQRIYANRYVSGTGWGTGDMIESVGPETGGAGEADVAMDGSGNAIAVWKQVEGTIINVYANRYRLP